MRKYKCGKSMTGILYMIGDTYRLAAKGTSVGLPHEIELNEKDLRHPEVQTALQRGWLVEVGAPAPEPLTISKALEPTIKCEHGFPIDEKCDYCAAGEKLTLPPPTILKTFEEKDTMDEEEAPEVLPERRRGRKKNAL